MKRIKIFKVYFILWLFVYFIAITNMETFKLYFMSTLTFNIAIVTLLAIGTIMLLKGAKEVVMLAGTFGVLMYKKRNLPFYIRGISKVLPGNIADKIKNRVENNLIIFTQQEKEEILSWIDEQFANQNKYNNFFIGTVLMIGLLGTFSGLLGAIGSMANIVMSLSGSEINISQVMAGFSGPLSSMAVGFGSSLFGVISAILLSIKGYLLNRAQASLLDGVENWLNANTVDTLQVQKEDSVENGLEIMHKQPAFMDMFVDKMGQLHKEISILNENNQTLHKLLMNSVEYMENIQNRQHQSMHSMAEAMQTLYNQNQSSKQSTDQLAQIVHKSNQKQQNLLSELVDLQKREIYQMTNLNTQIEDLAYMTAKSQQESTFDEEKISELLKNHKNDEQNILYFQMAENIEKMHRDIIKQMQNLKHNSLQTDEDQKNMRMQEASFLQKHFGLKKDKVN
jgi:hypothetical protein